MLHLYGRLDVMKRSQRSFRRANIHQPVRLQDSVWIISPIEHLYNEICMLPVREHNALIFKQFLLGWFRRNHPCSCLLEAEPPPRNNKRSLLDYVDDTEQYADQALDATNFKQWCHKHFHRFPSSACRTWSQITTHCRRRARIASWI